MPIKQVVLCKSACFNMVIGLLLLASHLIFADTAFSPSLPPAPQLPLASAFPPYVDAPTATKTIGNEGHLSPGYNAKSPSSLLNSLVVQVNETKLGSGDENLSQKDQKDLTASPPLYSNISPSTNSLPDLAPANNETNYYNQGNGTLSRDYLYDHNSPAPSPVLQIKGNEEVGPSPSSDNQLEDSNYSQQLQDPPMVNVDVDVDPAAMAQPSSVLPFNYKAEDEIFEFEQEDGSGSWDDMKHRAVTGVLVGLCVVGWGGFVYKVRRNKKRPHYY